MTTPADKLINKRTAACKYAAKNRGKINAYFKVYYEKNKEMINKKRRDKRALKKKMKNEMKLK